MRPIPSLLAAVTVLIATPSHSEQATLVGMLEKHGGCGEDGVAAVRVLFAKDGEQWISLSSVESAAPFDFADREWTIAFDGRDLGAVRTNDPGFHSEYAWTYPRDYRLTIASGQTLPAIANAHPEFAGWCFWPDVRPLVVNSHPDYQDPDQWKPFVVGRGYLELLFDSYFQALDEIPVCHNLPPGHEFTADDLALHKAYRDAVGRQLVALRLLPGGEWCDTDPSGAPIVWFAIADSLHHIGNDLELIDAGDYDGDGESEIVFWHASYNRDGYTILYDGLHRRAEFHWGYH